MASDHYPDFEPELPSRTHRRPGIGRSLAGWLVGIAFLVVVLGVGALVVMQFGGSSMPPRHTTSANASTSKVLSDQVATSGSGSGVSHESDSSAGTAASGTSVSKKGAISPVEPVRSARRPEQILSGELRQDRVVAASGSPYTLQGTVTVRRGVHLSIDPGTEVIAEPGSELVVHGQLATGGTPQSPVRFRSEPAGSGSWNGIRFEGDDCEAHLRGTVISDAVAAVTLDGAPALDSTKFQLEACLLTDNRTGLRIETMCSPRLRNAAIIHNRADAISAREDDGVYVQVTLAANGGKGYECLGKPAPQFDACTIVGNQKGGIHCGTAQEAFSPRWSATKCNLFSNGPFDVFCDHAGGVILSGNYWGSATNRVLRVLGDNPKNKPRSRIWDGLDPKHRHRGVVIASNFANDFLESAGAQPAVLAMAGGEPLEFVKPHTAKRRRIVVAEEEPNAPEVPPLFADIAAQLRELLGMRQYGDAAGLLDESLADPDLKEVSDWIKAAQEDVRLLEEFWQFAAVQMSKLNPGDTMSVDGIVGQLVEYRAGQVTVDASGVTRKKDFSKLGPQDLLLLVAGSDEAIKPELRLKIWLFLVADKQGLGVDADRWALQALTVGAELKGRGVYLIPKGKANAD